MCKRSDARNAPEDEARRHRSSARVVGLALHHARFIRLRHRLVREPLRVQQVRPFLGLLAAPATVIAVVRMAPLGYLVIAVATIPLAVEQHEIAHVIASHALSSHHCLIGILHISVVSNWASPLTRCPIQRQARPLMRLPVTRLVLRLVLTRNGLTTLRKC